MSEYSDRLVPGLAEQIELLLEPSDDLEEIRFNDDAIKILEKRYLIRDGSGNIIESPSQLLARVALSVAFHNEFKDSMWSKKFVLALEYYNMMARLDFLPNSPTLMNAGKVRGQLAACFVLPIEDSMLSIMDGVKNASLIFQSGGGVGYDFSNLRREGSLIKTTGGTSSGPISFMGMFDKMTDVVKQGGTRRGAQMGLLRCDHPDIRKFIECKDDDVSLQNFNISVAITNEFMQALEGNSGASNVPTYYELKDPKSSDGVYELEDAEEIWELIVKHAYKTGDPGIIFIDKINEDSPFDIDNYPEHIMVATNPCGEQPLESYEACNLGSINLLNYVWPDGFNKVYLGEIVRLAVRFLNDVIDTSIYPLPEINHIVKANRKIGLGVMGWADSLIKMHQTYGSQNSYDLARSIMSYIDTVAHSESAHLADIYSPFDTQPHTRNLNIIERNATLTTIAPTGTISMLANQVSSGIEPVFAFRQMKKVMDGTKFYTDHPSLLTLDVEVISTEGINKIFPWMVSSHEVTPTQHVVMQSAFQDFTDNAVSKTVNLSNDATESDIDEIYRLAYRLGCKGITIYRDGSKSDQVLFNEDKQPSYPDNFVPGTTNVTYDQFEDAAMDAFTLGFSLGTNEDKQPGFTDNVTSDTTSMTDTFTLGSDDDTDPYIPGPRPRPEVMLGMTVRAETPCGHLYVTISEDENGQPFEVFCKLGKSGACAGAVQETMGRLISSELRSGRDIDRLVKQLRGASCGQSVGFGPKRVTSCIDAIGLVLQRYQSGEFHDEFVQEFSTFVDEPMDKPVDMIHTNGPGAMHTDSPVDIVPVVRRNGACPECGSITEHEGGCVVCRSCGWSRCV